MVKNRKMVRGRWTRKFHAQLASSVQWIRVRTQGATCHQVVDSNLVRGGFLGRLIRSRNGWLFSRRYNISYNMTLAVTVPSIKKEKEKVTLLKSSFLFSGNTIDLLRLQNILVLIKENNNGFSLIYSSQSFFINENNDEYIKQKRKKKVAPKFQAKLDETRSLSHQKFVLVCQKHFSIPRKINLLFLSTGCLCVTYWVKFTCEASKQIQFQVIVFVERWTLVNGWRISSHIFFYPPKDPFNHLLSSQDEVKI